VVRAERETLILASMSPSSSVLIVFSGQQNGPKLSWSPPLGRRIRAGAATRAEDQLNQSLAPLPHPDKSRKKSPANQSSRAGLLKLYQRLYFISIVPRLGQFDVVGSRDPLVNWRLTLYIRQDSFSGSWPWPDTRLCEASVEQGSRLSFRRSITEITAVRLRRNLPEIREFLAKYYAMAQPLGP
jgi:hypothetical protein